MNNKEWQWWQWLSLPILGIFQIGSTFSQLCFKLTFFPPSTESSFPELDGESELSRTDGGKLTYERDFLLQFQTNPMCMLKPEGLPDLEVVLGQARPPSKSGYQQK